MSKRKTVIGTPYWSVLTHVEEMQTAVEFISSDTVDPNLSTASFGSQPWNRMIICHRSINSLTHLFHYVGFVDLSIRMAPEVLQSTEYNGKADIWSLAITAIELAVGEPPHSNVHPMRAIFAIPNSDPPTLPDPSQWSADFNDFLKVCLVKNPEKRPTATELLKTHPFILKAKSKAIIAQLVDECMQEIDDYRAQEAAEAAANQGQGETGAVGSASSTANGGATMSSTVNSGTMVHDPTSRSGPNYDAGTMVFNSGTMIGGANLGGHDYDDTGAGDYGTMVLHSATLAKPPPPAALNEQGTSRSGTKYEEPSYMRHMREASNKFKNPTATGGGGGGVGGASTTGTMLVSGAPSSSSSHVTPNDFRDLYRTQRKFEASQLDQLSKEDLKATIAALEKAHLAEKSALEAAYDNTKNLLKSVLDKKK